MTKELANYLSELMKKNNLKTLKMTNESIEIEAYPAPFEMPKELQQAMKPLSDEELLENPYQGIPGM